jgi:hypothetical protein
MERCDAAGWLMAHGLPGGVHMLDKFSCITGAPVNNLSIYGINSTGYNKNSRTTLVFFKVARLSIKDPLLSIPVLRQVWLCQFYE